MYYVYVMTNRRHGTLYVGMTNDLIKRVGQHKQNMADGFTSKWGLHTLVYFEMIEHAYEAIQREKRFKKWNRSWKVQLIDENNPDWADLYPEILGMGPRSSRG